MLDDIASNIYLQSEGAHPARESLSRITTVTIHQIQLRYEPLADRLLLSVRTHAAELYTAWLTRRMAAQLAGPLRQAVARLALPPSAAGALPVPEVQQMLEQVARERPLKDADFKQSFAGVADASYPLGPEPLLPEAIDLRSPPTGGLTLALREQRGRRLDLNLNNDLATALQRLFDQALLTADWGLVGASPRPNTDTDTDTDADAGPVTPVAPQRLN